MNALRRFVCRWACRHRHTPHTPRTLARLHAYDWGDLAATLAATRADDVRLYDQRRCDARIDADRREYAHWALRAKLIAAGYARDPFCPHRRVRRFARSFGLDLRGLDIMRRLSP